MRLLPAVQHMELEVPGAPVRRRQSADQPLPDLVEVTGAGVIDFRVLLKHLLRGLVADLFLVVGAGRANRPPASAAAGSAAAAAATRARQAARRRKRRRLMRFRRSDGLARIVMPSILLGIKMFLLSA